MKLTALQTAPFVSLPPGQVRRWPNLPALATKNLPQKITSEVAALSKPPRFPFSTQEKCVGGRCPTSLLVCVSPSLDDAPESLGSLELGSRAMGVKVVAEQNRGTVFMDAEVLAQDLAQTFRVCTRRSRIFSSVLLHLKVVLLNRKTQGPRSWCRTPGEALVVRCLDFHCVLETPERLWFGAVWTRSKGRFHGRRGARLTLRSLSGHSGVFLR